MHTLKFTHCMQLEIISWLIVEKRYNLGCINNHVIQISKNLSRVLFKSLFSYIII